MVDLNREYQRECHRRAREEIRVGKMMTCKVKRLMGNLLQKVSRHPLKYQRRVRRAIRSGKGRLLVYRSEGRIWNRYSFGDEMGRPQFSLEFAQVISNHRYDDRLRDILGFEKAYFRSYTEKSGFSGGFLLRVEICWE